MPQKATAAAKEIADGGDVGGSRPASDGIDTTKISAATSAPVDPLTIEVPGLPVAWARAGRGKGFTFTPKKQRNAMSDLKAIAATLMRDRPLLDVPLHVDFYFEYPWPKSMSAKRRAIPGNRWRTSRPDGDNLIKLCADGLNGIVWTDDAIIVSARLWKCYGDRARTLIVVRPAAEEGRP